MLDRVSRTWTLALRAVAFSSLLAACDAPQTPEVVADGGLLVPDAGRPAEDAGLLGDDAGVVAELDAEGFLTLAEFRGSVNVSRQSMTFEVLEGEEVSSPSLRRLQQGLCALNIVQDGVPGSGPANSVELVTGSTGLDAACVGYLSSPVFCGNVTIRSFYAALKSDVFAQITTLAPSTGYAVQNGDVVPGASSGLGSFSYGNLAAAPGLESSAMRPWVFARSGGNFTFQGRVIVNTVEECNGVDDDCDGRTDEGAGCFAGGTECAATSDCSAGLTCSSTVCAAPVGAPCASNAECASGFCATGPTGTANDRCAPTGMNYIPAGTFIMGSPSDELGRSLHETQNSVTLSRPFFMGQTEVTQGQWKALSGGTNPSCYQSTTCDDTFYCGCTFDNAHDNGPVERVDWYAAVAFANARSAAEGLASCYTLTGCTDAANGWKDGDHDGCTGATFSGLTCTGYRLPTESEWEYAARAGTSTATYLGNLSGTTYDCSTAQANLDSIAWYCVNSRALTYAVGGKAANAFGLYDMLGNVYEWTNDLNNFWSSTGLRVLRGGAWYTPAEETRAAMRDATYPEDREFGGGFFPKGVGFRLSRTVTRGCTTALPLNATAGVEAGNTAGWDACEATSCATSYHVEGGLCVSDTRTCSPLPANTTAGTQTWDSSTGAYGTCTATACSASYHIETGACVSDTRTCSPLPANTTAATQTWDSSTGAYGTCTATACAECYTLSGGACIGSLGPGILGTTCAGNCECASGFCATGPTGTANDRCAPTGMNYIPAGTFLMNTPEEGNIHTVTLSRAFFMGQTEVTQGQWKALSGGTNPSCYQSTIGTSCTPSNANDSGPVERTDWYAAVAFANARSAAEGLASCYTLTGCANAANGWKDGDHNGCTGATFAGLTCTGYRLPTESEWEYAARAGTTTDTYLGNLSGTVTDCTIAQANLDGIAWWCNNSNYRTQAVGGKAANAFGLYDMLGNVSEWTGDWYASYPGTVTDPLGADTGSSRVVRGGAWWATAFLARAGYRGYLYNPTESYLEFNFEQGVGFRLSRTAP